MQYFIAYETQEGVIYIYPGHFLPSIPPHYRGAGYRLGVRNICLSFCLVYANTLRYALFED